MKALGTISLAAMFLIACGGGSNRQLQSITVNPSSATAQSGQAQFTATGQFNADPMSVTPAMVAWVQTGVGFDPPGDPIAFTLTSQPFTGKCFVPGTTFNVTAFAPMNANSADGTIPLQVFLDLTVRHTTSQEGGFVAGSGQLTCP